MTINPNTLSINAEEAKLLNNEKLGIYHINIP